MSQENVEVVRKGFEAFNRTFNEGAPDLYEVLSSANRVDSYDSRP